ncbi:MAG: MoaD/ThiS family protein [Armatimonadetes bacterium]|nr:MoaD/ThiS family protein [Armatimonadota bacterium]
MITIRIRYFAVLRDRRGLQEEHYHTQCSTVEQLVNELIAKYRLGLPSALIRVAINSEFVEPNVQLEDGMEIVLIPPVAGG